MTRNKEEMSEYNQAYRKSKLEEDPNFFKDRSKTYRDKKKKEDPDFFNHWKRENVDKVREYRKSYNRRHADKIIVRKQVKRELLNRIKLNYGCCNPECGWNGRIEPCALDFHHLESDSKNKCVTEYVRYSMDRMIKEVVKCTVLCAVCHRSERFGFLDASDFLRCNVGIEGNIIAE